MTPADARILVVDDNEDILQAARLLLKRHFAAVQTLSDPAHLATYHVLGQVLLRLGRTDDAKRVLQAGVHRVAGVGEGMGRDLGPAMQALLDGI